MREITLELKFDTENPFQFQAIPVGALFMRADEGEKGNIYVKPLKRLKKDPRTLLYNLSKPGICVWVYDSDLIYLRVF